MPRARSRCGGAGSRTRAPYALWARGAARPPAARRRTAGRRTPPTCCAWPASPAPDPRRRAARRGALRLFDAVAAPARARGRSRRPRGRARRPALGRPLLAGSAAPRRARRVGARACCSCSPIARTGLERASAATEVLGGARPRARLRAHRARGARARRGPALRARRTRACATRSCATCTSARAATRSSSRSSPARSPTSATGPTAVPDSVREVVLRRLAPLPGREPPARSTPRPCSAGRSRWRPSPGSPRSRARGARGARAGARRPARHRGARRARPARLRARDRARRRARGARALPRRGPLHAAVVEVLRGGTEVRVAEVAHHALVAAREGEDPQAAYELSRRGRRGGARRCWRTPRRRGHYADALEALDELGAEAPPAERAAALGALAAATMAAGDIEARPPPLSPRGSPPRGARPRRRGSRPRGARASPSSPATASSITTAVALLEEALAVLPPVDSPLRAARARAAGRPAGCRRRTSRSERLVDEAAAMARRLDDPDALTFALWVASARLLAPRGHAVRLAAADEILALATARERRQRALWAHMCALRRRARAGRIRPASRPSWRPARLSSAAPGAATSAGASTLLRATSATFSGRLAEGAALAEDAAAQIGGAAQDAEQELTVQRLTLAKLRWRPQDADDAALRAYAARYRELPVWSAMHANLAWELGRADQVAEAVGGDGARRRAGSRRRPRRAVGLRPARGARRRPRATTALPRSCCAVLDARIATTTRSWITAGRPGARSRGRSGCSPRRSGAPATRSVLFDRAVTLSRRWGAPRLGAARDRRLARQRRGRARAARPCSRAASGSPTSSSCRGSRAAGQPTRRARSSRSTPVAAIRRRGGVAVAAPVASPGVADDEAGLGVADERAGVALRALARLVPGQERIAPDERAIETRPGAAPARAARASGASARRSSRGRRRRACSSAVSLNRAACS